MPCRCSNLFIKFCPLVDVFNKQAGGWVPQFFTGFDSTLFWKVTVISVKE
jgi:hypothetical protein